MKDHWHSRNVVVSPALVRASYHRKHHWFPMGIEGPGETASSYTAWASAPWRWTLHSVNLTAWTAVSLRYIWQPRFIDLFAITLFLNEFKLGDLHFMGKLLNLWDQSWFKQFILSPVEQKILLFDSILLGSFKITKLPICYLYLFDIYCKIQNVLIFNFIWNVVIQPYNGYLFNICDVSHNLNC